MQKNVCAICLQPVKLNIDILQQSEDIKCVHYSCLDESQVGQRILAQASCEDQSDELEKMYRTSSRLSKRPAFIKLTPFKQRFNLRCTSKPLCPVQEYCVAHEVYTRTSNSFKTSSCSESTKWFSSMRKNSYKILPPFIKNKCFQRKDQQYKLPQNQQEDDTTIFPFTINASGAYSSEILDWLAMQNKNKANSLPEKPAMPQPATSSHQKKKVTIQESCDPYLKEHRNGDYRKPFPRRNSRRRKEMPSISTGSQYSNHSSRLSAADFMDWVTSAPKIPNGNMLILLDCRNKKDTKNIGIQLSFIDPERYTARKTAESLIFDLLERRKKNELQYDYYSKCQIQGSSVTLVRNGTNESRIATCLHEKDNDHEVSVVEEPIYIYPDTVEERMHHVVSIVFNALGHVSSFVGRLAQVMKEEFSFCDKNVDLNNKS